MTFPSFIDELHPVCRRVPAWFIGVGCFHHFYQKVKKRQEYHRFVTSGSRDLGTVIDIPPLPALSGSPFGDIL